MFGKEFHNLKALAVEPFVHVFADLFQHHFDLPLGSLERKDPTEHGADDCAEYAG